MSESERTYLDTVAELAELPAGAPLLLCWLLDGPMPIEAMIVRVAADTVRRAGDPHGSLAQDRAAAWSTATRSVLYDLGHLTGYVRVYSDGLLALNDRHREAVCLYRAIRRLPYPDTPPW